MSLQRVKGTDGFYKAFIGTECIGMVRKCYTGRSSYVWTIEPADYVQRTTLRVGYRTRQLAHNALHDYRYDGKRRRVEG